MPGKSEKKERVLEEGMRSSIFNVWPFLRGKVSSIGLSVFFVVIHQH